MGATPDQKACSQQFSEENLDMFRANPENFLSRIITGDETWVHHHDPETKQASMQWKHKGSPTPKKCCVQQSAGKIMATFFFTQKVFHKGGFTREYQRETPWKVVGWSLAAS